MRDSKPSKKSMYWHGGGAWLVVKYGYLLCKQETRVQISSIHINARHARLPVVPALQSRDRQILGTRWLASLAKVMNF